METKKKQQSTKNGGNPPKRTYRDLDLSVKIWENSAEKDGETRTFLTTTIERSYKDKEDKLQSTKNLRIQDMPRAALLLQKAYEEERIKLYENGNGKDGAEDSDDSDSE